MLIVSGDGRENRGLWWLGKGVFGGPAGKTSGDLERIKVAEQRGVFGRQEDKILGVSGEFKVQKKNSVKGRQAHGTEDSARGCNNEDARERNSKTNNSQRRDRPKGQISNAREESTRKALKVRTHHVEGPKPQKDQSRTGKENLGQLNGL